jgi:hypothetical protein
VTSIEAESRAAASRNGRRPSARSRIEAAAAAAKAAGEAMGELYANPLIARLDIEGLGGELSEADLEAILHMVRRLEMPAPLPQRRSGNGAGGQHAGMLP